MSQAYVIKWAEETAWAVGIAVGVFAFEALTTQDVTQWQTWGSAALAGCVRVAAAVLLNQVRKLKNGGQ